MPDTMIPTSAVPSVSPAMPAEIAKAIERFETHYMPEPNSGCWLWASGVTRGYGMFSFLGRSIKAHRMAYLLYRGPIPDGMCIMHSCDMPSCVNPDHLSVGTVAENNRDKGRKGRGADRKGEKHPLRKLSLSQVRQIRELKGVLTPKAIAEKFSMSKSHVNAILRGEFWSE